MPKYTIIIPAKNSSETVGAAVRSALRAFPDDSAVVVWDDGSDDDTAEQAIKAGGRKVSVMSCEKSVGSGVARQCLIDATDSEFVINQDSDDISLPWRGMVQSRLLKSADFVFTGIQRFANVPDFYAPASPLWYSSRDVSIALLVHNPLSQPSFAARRSALEDVGGYGKSRVAQDNELWIRAVLGGKSIVKSSIPCVGYRVSSGQISRQSDYRRRVKESQELITAYRGLLGYHFPLVDGSVDYAVGNSWPKISMQDLDQLIASMSPILRLRYRRLISNRRFHDFAAEVFV